MNRTKWNLEKLQEEALKYKSRGEFQKYSKTAYNLAQRKGLLVKICHHMESYDIRGDKNPNFKWTTQALSKEAAKYKTRGEFKNKSPKAYLVSWERGILNEICSHMKSLLTHWTSEELALEALKYKSRKEFQSNGNNAYQIACKRGLINSLCSHMEYINYPWKNEELKEEALKYKTKTEFLKKNNAAFQAAYKRNLLNQICSHMESCQWTNEDLVEEALKYKSRKEFQLNNNGAYSTAQHRGLLNEICKHAPKIKGTSLVEKEIFDFIKNFCPDAIENDRENINPKELDIFIPSLNLAIEYCGLYWHSEEYRDKNYHFNKMQLCNQKGIRLITIFEDEWLERKEQVKNFLLSVLNKNSIKIMARKTELKEVPKKEAVQFLEENHIQGSAILDIAFGLYYFNELVAVITGSKHHRQGHDCAFVLNRLAFKSEISIIGGSSKLLKALLEYTKHNRYKKLISWSDNRWSEGRVYKALGFQLTGNLPRDYSYIREQKRISKQSCTKKALAKKGAVGSTEHEMALSLKLYRIWDCGKKRWEMDL